MTNKHYNGHCKDTEEDGDKKHLEKRSGERNVDSRFHVELKKDGGSSRRQSSIETSVL